MTDDDFRNVCAFHFGKGYFDNFIGSVHSDGVGILGSTSNLDKSLVQIQICYDLYLFVNEILNDPENAQGCLDYCFKSFDRAADTIRKMFFDFSITTWKSAEHTNDRFNTPPQDIVWAMAILQKYAECLKPLAKDLGSFGVC